MSDFCFVTFSFGAIFPILNIMTEVIVISAAKARLTKSFDSKRPAGMSNVLTGTSFFKYLQNNKTMNMQDLEKKTNDCSQVILCMKILQSGSKTFVQ